MIQWDINDSGVYGMLNHLDEGSRELPMDQISQVMLDAVQQNFDEEGRPDPWEPRQDDNPWPILTKTGALRGSITADIGQDSVMINHETDYGDYHQEGTSRMPARPFLILTDDDQDRIEEVISNWFDALMHGH